MELEKFYNNRVLVADLESGECREEELGEELVQSRLGGAALNLELLKRFPDDDPLVIGTGLLTASFCPASGLGMVTARSPRSGMFVHHPFTGSTGQELKLSGFDFVVVQGRSSKPVRLWLHDELAEISDAEELVAQGTAASTARLQDEYGDMNIQALLVGPAGLKGSPLAMVSENGWGGWDKAGVGAALAEKGLFAVVVRGLGSFEVAEGIFAEAQKLMKESAASFKGRAGTKEILQALNAGEAAGMLDRATHRHSACFNCPFPCRTFAFLREDPSRKHETEQSDPGFLSIDPSGLLGLAFLGDDALAVYERCLQAGVDPTAAGLILQAEGISEKAAALNGIDAIVEEKKDLAKSPQGSFRGVSPWSARGDLSSALVQASGIFSNGIPPAILPLSDPAFSLPEDPAERAAVVLERAALGFILGICPVFLLSSPVVSPERAAEVVKIVTEWDECSGEELQSRSRGLIRETLEAGTPQGEITPGLKPEGFDQAWEALSRRWGDS